MKRYFFSGILLLAFVVLPVVALAEDPLTGSGGSGYSQGALPGSGSSGLPPSSLSGSGASGNTGQPLSPSGGYQVKNPLAANSFCGLVKNLLQAAIAIGIPIAVLFIVYAGFKFVLARGNPEKLAEARTNFLWTIIGIAIFLGAWLLASVVANTVNQLGGGQNIISCN